MKKILVFLCVWAYSITCFSFNPLTYMDRFNQYWTWSQQVPPNPGPAFFEFIKGQEPLSKKLREHYLYELARTKDWANFTQYYQSTNDLNLLCFYQTALYNQGLKKKAAEMAAPLWLSGDLRPAACNTLFDLLLKDGQFSQNLITQRIALALENRNISLAQSLIKKYKLPHPQELKTLNSIYQNPQKIALLTKGELSDALYLYGLKRMISQNMQRAVTYWSQPKTKKILNEAKQQAFLIQLAVYKAMRNSEDSSFWFTQIKKQFYTETLLDWQIRYALKHGKWKQVAQLIQASSNKDSPCWQYWLARALEEQGMQDKAVTIYQSLANSRQYYGFLAATRLNKKPHFENEKPYTNFADLKAYTPFIEQVKKLYLSKQSLQASRMLNDFISELPKDQASALVYWVDTNLHWHGKSVYLSNNDTLNNQLTLRFPLAFQSEVQYYAKRFDQPPEFVYAIIRQESGFREDVVSSAGARGLMQLMPNTATVVSKANKIPYINQKQLFLSQKNINIGIAYLQQLAKRFRNHPVLIAASYNAGPKQVVHWLKTHPPKEIDIWIETLPWVETRNYLKNVMAFYVVYQYRLNQKPNLHRFLTPFSST